jgi:hypothetical protein
LPDSQGHPWRHCACRRVALVVRPPRRDSPPPLCDNHGASRRKGLDEAQERSDAYRVEDGHCKTVIAIDGATTAVTTLLAPVSEWEGFIGRSQGKIIRRLHATLWRGTRTQQIPRVTRDVRARFVSGRKASKPPSPITTCTGSLAKAEGPCAGRPTHPPRTSGRSRGRHDQSRHDPVPALAHETTQRRSRWWLQR